MGGDEKDGNLPRLQQSPAPDSDAHVIPQKYISQDNGDGKEPENKCPIAYVPPEGGSFNLTTAIFFPLREHKFCITRFLDILKKINK